MTETFNIPANEVLGHKLRDTPGRYAILYTDPKLPDTIQFWSEGDDLETLRARARELNEHYGPNHDYRVRDRKEKKVYRG